MPIYEYQCTDCGHRLEAIQKHSDAPLSDCPHCHKPTLQKLVSAPAFRLSGGGWYETDFKSDKEKKRNLAGDSSGSGADKSASKSGDANSKSGDSKTTPAESKAKPANAGSSGSQKPAA